MYAAEGDLRRYLGRHSVQLTDTSRPSTADALVTMAAVSGEIDAALSGRGAIVPVAAPASFVAALRDLEAIGTAARTVGSLNPAEEGTDSSSYQKELQDLYDAGLARLREGPLPDGVALTTSGGMGRSFATTHPDYFAADYEGTPGNQTDPVIRRDTQW